MLTPYRPQFIEKVLTDAAGRRFRVVFAVSFVDGEARGRIVSATEINTLKLAGEVQAAVVTTPLCLGGSHASATSAKPVSTFARVISPYFSHDYLITAQPTRAPSRI